MRVSSSLMKIEGGFFDSTTQPSISLSANHALARGLQIRLIDERSATSMSRKMSRKAASTAQQALMRMEVVELLKNQPPIRKEPMHHEYFK